MACALTCGSFPLRGLQNAEHDHGAAGSLGGHSTCEDHARILAIVLDVLLATVPEGKRADFLFQGRHIIAEMKDLNAEAQTAWTAYIQEGMRLGQKHGFDPRREEMPLDKLSYEERAGFSGF